MITQCPNPACRKYNLIEGGPAACLLCRTPLPAPAPDDDALFPPVVADDAALGLD